MYISESHVFDWMNRFGEACFAHLIRIGVNLSVTWLHTFHKMDGYKTYALHFSFIDLPPLLEVIIIKLVPITRRASSFLNSIFQ